MGMKQKKIKKKIQNGWLKKSLFLKIANSQKIFTKISQMGPWVSRIEWCEGHWCSSTYMAVRLSDKSSKTAKKSWKCITASMCNCRELEFFIHYLIISYTIIFILIYFISKHFCVFILFYICRVSWLFTFSKSAN